MVNATFFFFFLLLLKKVFLSAIWKIQKVAPSEFALKKLNPNPKSHNLPKIMKNSTIFPRKKGGVVGEERVLPNKFDCSLNESTTKEEKEGSGKMKKKKKKLKWSKRPSDPQIH